MQLVKHAIDNSRQVNNQQCIFFPTPATYIYASHTSPSSSIPHRKLGHRPPPPPLFNNRHEPSSSTWCLRRPSPLRSTTTRSPRRPRPPSRSSPGSSPPPPASGGASALSALLPTTSAAPAFAPLLATMIGSHIRLCRLGLPSLRSRGRGGRSLSLRQSRRRRP